MRIGNTDDLEQSGKSDDLIQLLLSDNRQSPATYPKWKNWWYYHKWYVIVSIIIFSVFCTLAGNALGLFTKSPDLQIAYVGSVVLPQDTVNAIQKTFVSLAGDYNQDGEIIVQINQYILSRKDANAETAYSGYASEVALTADISDGESYFFLLEDPQDFQQTYQALAMPDGSCPSHADFSASGKTLLWKNCPPLADADMGTYTETIAGRHVSGDNQELLSDLYLGRRCFYNDRISENVTECAALWDFLYGI